MSSAYRNRAAMTDVIPCCLQGEAKIIETFSDFSSSSSSSSSILSTRRLRLLFLFIVFIHLIFPFVFLLLLRFDTNKTSERIYKG